MTKKTAAALATASFLALSGMAFAQTASTSVSANASVSTGSSAKEAMLLNVNGSGKVLLRGTIDSVSATSITVKSWGGEWTISVPASAEVLPQGTALASFQQGDFVGVEGTVDQSANWTIDAAVVRDWTARQALSTEVKQNVQAVHSMTQSGPRTIQGTLSSLSGQSFTLTTAGGASYSVTLASGAKLLQGNWRTLDFTKVQNGDRVRVWGPVSSSTISASIFRDLTIK